MKRSRQESSGSEASGFLFATEAPASENEDNASLLPEEIKDEQPKKTVKRARKSTKVNQASEQTLVSSPESEVAAGSSLFGADVSDSSTEPAGSAIQNGAIEQAADCSSDAQSQDAEIVVQDQVPSEASPFEQSAPQEQDSLVESNVPAQPESTVASGNAEESAVKPPEPTTIPNSTSTPAQAQEDLAPAPTPSARQSQEIPTPVVSDSKPSSYQVVARRYRPQTFDELIGQETVARALSNAIETDRVGHAYLFTGARGVGKTSCARIFAKALNCVEGPTTRPCLKCDSCLAIATGDDVDVIEIDGASNRGVDEIRQLRQNATIAPTRSLYKIYIIDEVHMLTREAFNALLKTLEEPPARVKFIFCTTEPNKIPITILSRCQRFDFGGINGNSISERLAQIAQQEGAQAEDGVFDILARRANGSMRDAQSLLEQLLSFAPKYISQNDVHNMLGSVDDKKIFDLLNATVAGDAARAFELLGESARQGVDFGVLLEQTLGVYRDLMVVSSGCGPKELMYTPVARMDELQQTAKELGMRRILASLQILDQTAQRMRVSPQARILAEVAFARLCRLDSFQALETLITQLKQGLFPNVPISLPSSCDGSASDEQKKNKVENSKTLDVVGVIPPAVSSKPVPQVDVPEVAPRVPDVPSTPSPTPSTTPPLSERQSDEPPYASMEPTYSPEEYDELVRAPQPIVKPQQIKRPEEAPATRPAVQNAPWLSYSSDLLAQIWGEATNAGVVLPSKASAFGKVHAEEPNQFVVSFPADATEERDYCESEKQKIAGRLAKKLGGRVALRCVTDPSVSRRVSSSVDSGSDDYRPANRFTSNNAPANIEPQRPFTPSPSRYSNRQFGKTNSSDSQPLNFREVSQQLENNDSVRELKELFDAELSEVKQIPKQERQTNYFF